MRPCSEFPVRGTLQPVQETGSSQAQLCSQGRQDSASNSLQGSLAALHAGLGSITLTTELFPGVDLK